MHRGWLAALAWYGVGCAASPCSEWREWNEPFVLAESQMVTAESGTPGTEVPIVWTLHASHVVSSHFVDDGRDGTCEYTYGPLTGARVQVRPEGGDAFELVEGVTGEYSGPTYYASRYTQTIDDGDKTWESDYWMQAALFTVAATATTDSLQVSWVVRDNPNDVPIAMSITDDGGNLLYSTTELLDRGTSTFATTVFPTVVASAARVSIKRFNVTMWTNVTR